MPSSDSPQPPSADKMARLPNPPTVHTDTTPNAYQREIYAQFRSPFFSTKPAEWERLAAKNVPAANLGYVTGSASTQRTYHANLSAFDRFRLRPRMLVDATSRDLSVELFGTRYPTPILVAPVGVQAILHKDGEEATARACRDLKLPMILSSAATRTIEEVAAANGDGKRWYQLYWPSPQNEDITASLLQRAKANGYEVLVVTLDTFTLGWRPTDLDEAYLPFVWGQGCQIGFSDPAFHRHYERAQREDKRSYGERIREAYETMRKPGSVYGAAKVLANLRTLRKSQAWMSVMFHGIYPTWNDLAVLKKYWDGPIVLKGIQTVEDAQKAIEHGMDGIIVSNHGGRQLNGAIGSLDALELIAADSKVKESGIEILFDSGIRTGSDVLKAIALGAKAVLVARPYMYGLAIAGEQGVKHVLACICADTDNSMANMGKRHLSELSRDDLQILPYQATAKL